MHLWREQFLAVYLFLWLLAALWFMERFFPRLCC